MVRSNGARLLSRLARRSLSSNLVQGAPSPLFQGLIRGGFRQFGSIFSHDLSSTSLNSIKGANQRNWLKLGLVKPNYILGRSIHDSAGVAAKDYYDTLRISRDATTSEIKKAYYELAKKLHPDKNKDDQEAEKKFQEVQKAYEVLKDDQKRQVYDQVGHDAFERAGNGDTDSGFSPFDMNDIFTSALNLGGRDVEVSLELSFMEAIQGCSKTLTFQTELNCQACGGTGAPPGTRPETCKQCKGSGVIVRQDGNYRMMFDCSLCGGSGKIVKNLCKSCNGRRVVRGRKSVNVNVMPGIDANDTINMPRSGGADPEGKRPGDLDVIIKVRDDPIFRRKGSDIHVNAILSITQAILGGVVQVPTLTGDVAVKVRSGTQPGQKVVLKGKGIRTRKSFSFGDQYVHFIVSIPENLSDRQREIIEEFAKQEQGEDDEPAVAAAASN